MAGSEDGNLIGCADDEAGLAGAAFILAAALMLVSLGPLAMWVARHEPSANLLAP